MGVSSRCEKGMTLIEMMITLVLLVGVGTVVTRYFLTTLNATRAERLLASRDELQSRMELCLEDETAMTALWKSDADVGACFNLNGKVDCDTAALVKIKPKLKCDVVALTLQTGEKTMMGFDDTGGVCDPKEPTCPLEVSVGGPLGNCPGGQSSCDRLVSLGFHWEIAVKPERLPKGLTAEGMKSSGESLYTLPAIPNVPNNTTCPFGQILLPDGTCRRIFDASCPKGTLLRGFDDIGKPLCDAAQPLDPNAPPKTGCPPNTLLTGMDAKGNPQCLKVNVPAGWELGLGACSAPKIDSQVQCGKDEVLQIVSVYGGKYPVPICKRAHWYSWICISDCIQEDTLKCKTSGFVCGGCKKEPEWGSELVAAPQYQCCKLIANPKAF